MSYYADVVQHDGDDVRSRWARIPASDLPGNGEEVDVMDACWRWLMSTAASSAVTDGEDAAVQLLLGCDTMTAIAGFNEERKQAMYEALAHNEEFPCEDLPQLRDFLRAYSQLPVGRDAPPCGVDVPLNVRFFMRGGNIIDLPLTSKDVAMLSDAWRLGNASKMILSFDNFERFGLCLNELLGFHATRLVPEQPEEPRFESRELGGGFRG